ncbi:hypothetical protein [Glaciimonas sp. PAMC28666]|uniref:hypothetical protein n=1 Tax=Glaciimonas sp. PAMC28666 TaxID=2807626 RepID=UPI001966475E|nr:hypothetical protein [Glaciimonas sp. PAMC28666]QRX83113.1 hypothetical protein JQN73_02140 [Glaciimonas sp. PAMC28666]
MVTLFTWPIGETSATLPFWGAMIYWPVTAWLIVLGIWIEKREARRLDHVVWNLRRDQHLEVWGRWARQYLKVLGHEVILAEDDLAVRLTGLDGGGLPALTRKPMTVPMPEKGGARIDRILQMLLTKLESTLRSIDCAAIEVILHTGDASQYAKAKLVVQRLWHEAGLAGQPTILTPEKSNTDPIDFLDAWIDKPFAGMRLVLAWQLKPDNASTLEYTEGAVGILLIDARMRVPAERYGAPVLLRPMISGLNELSESTIQLNSFKPIPIGKIRHVWTTGISASVGIALQAAFFEAGVVLKGVGGLSGLHNIDSATAKPGPISYWLTLAAALDLMAAGHGAQCIAQAAPEGMSLTPIGCVAPTTPTAGSEKLLSLFTLGGVMASVGTIMVMGGLRLFIDHPAVNAGAYSAEIVGAVIVAAAVPVTLFTRYLTRFTYIDTQMYEAGYTAGTPGNGRSSLRRASFIDVAEAPASAVPTDVIPAAE